MRPMSDAVLIRETLAWCNRIRVACNNPTLAEMPSGKKTHASECPIAMALSNGLVASVDTITISVMIPAPRRYSPEYKKSPLDFEPMAKALRRLNLRDVDILTYSDYKTDDLDEQRGEIPYGVTFLTPLIMEEFIQRFDDGKLPQLIEGRK